VSVVLGRRTVKVSDRYCTANKVSGLWLKSVWTRPKRMMREVAGGETSVESGGASLGLGTLILISYLRKNTRGDVLQANRIY
jgi:hypothetical protein